MSSPSAPAATAARAMGGTRSRRPVPCEGSADDRQMRKLLHHRDRGNIHRVARVSFESADAALAQNHFVVAAGENVFRREQQFFDGGRQCRVSAAPACAAFPSSRSRLKFCMLRAPICRISEYAASRGICVASITSLITSRPRRSAAVAQQLQAFFAQCPENCTARSAV